MRIFSPTGVLGAGFTEESLRRGVAARPHVIACDAGSTDSGPAALGSGTAKLSYESVRRDLELLLMARAELGVPLIIGSCGTSGTNQGVDWVADIAREIADEKELVFRLALIYSDQQPDVLEKLWDEGRIHPLDPAPQITAKDLASSRVVAMMGVEPIEAALRDGADVVLAGRASDTALFAAWPHMHGADPGLIWHMAKTIECGAACAVPPSADGMLVTLRDDHFDVEVLQPGSRLTPRSVAAHTLYENADPFLVVEPSGVLDTEHATYEAVSDTIVRVRGAQFRRADSYTVKLEGARPRGYQTIAIGGVRDPLVISRIRSLLPMAQHHFAERITSIFHGRVDPDDVDIRFTLYGQDAVLGTREPESHSPIHELAVLITITAESQEIAHAVCATVAHVMSHLPIPEYDGLASTIAYPFSPPEIDRGLAYEFTLNHVVRVADPMELFAVSMSKVAR